MNYNRWFYEKRLGLKNVRCFRKQYHELLVNELN